MKLEEKLHKLREGMENNSTMYPGEKCFENYEPLASTLGEKFLNSF
jgi:hypothetical protein